jgi:hypothetical protein
MILMYTGDEILALSNRLTMVNFGYAVDLNDIKVNNTGRLAAKFLRSFFPDSVFAQKSSDQWGHSPVATLSRYVLCCRCIFH